MKILYIADGRSPIALNWIGYFIGEGHEVHLASTYHCKPIAGLASMTTVPVAASGTYNLFEGERGEKGKLLRRLLPVRLRTRLRQLLAPMTFTPASKAIGELADRIQPDLMHAMRIPYEGMLASTAVKRGITRGGGAGSVPLLVSIWGNDFTLHARSTPSMTYYTRQTLQYCAAIHTDCQRDLREAREWGFEPTKSGIVLPGGGGVRLDVFYPAEDRNNQAGEVTIINPRGFRAYVKNDTFFNAIPLVLGKFPNVRFTCPSMAGEPEAQKWLKDLGIAGKVTLLPAQSQEQMAELFRQSMVSLSITTHDGTPNTLLEAMASGCFPVAGDIESLREWITPGDNGLLVDPGDPGALAMAIQQAITQPELCRRARQRNLELVKERGEYRKCTRKAEEFYKSLVRKNNITR